MAYQEVCAVDAMDPSCEHDRIAEFWGDGGEGMILGANMSEGDFMAADEAELFRWTRAVLHRCGSYLAQEPAGLNDCERFHQQRLAMDLVRLLAIVERRGLSVAKVWA